MTQPTTRLGRLTAAAERAGKRAVAAREEAEKAEAKAKAKRQALASAEKKAAAWRRGACLRAMGLGLWQMYQHVMTPEQRDGWLRVLTSQPGLSVKTAALIKEALEDSSFDARDRSLGKTTS